VIEIDEGLFLFICLIEINQSCDDGNQSRVKSGVFTLDHFIN